MTLESEVIEAWFFDKEEDARSDNKENAVGYSKVVDATLVEMTGRDTKFAYLHSVRKTKE
jgi:hypothetical protein